MAKLVDVFQSEQTLSRRQLPLVVDGALTMVMDLKNLSLISDGHNVKGKETDEISRKIGLLTAKELNSALEVTKPEILHVLNQSVPCVGCRRSVERLYYQLYKYGYPTLDPIVIKSDGIITVKEDKKNSAQFLSSLFHGHSSRLDKLVDSQPRRHKKSHRCLLHSLDSQRSRQLLTSAWREVWECMRPDCRRNVCIIEASCLSATLDTYLRKHRFCAECRTKVLKAYSLLIDEPEPTKERGYSASLYSGIKRCLPERHIHLPSTKTDYIGKLIGRAEPELFGSRRERHAKTLEIAQEEVLTCIGICMYERLNRVHMRLREEECTCRVLAAVAVDALWRRFETVVESKQGVSQLDLLYAELTREEQQKQQRKEQKKLRRKRKKAPQEKTIDDDEEEEDTADNVCSDRNDVLNGKSLHNNNLYNNISITSPFQDDEDDFEDEDFEDDEDFEEDFFEQEDLHGCCEKEDKFTICSVKNKLISTHDNKRNVNGMDKCKCANGTKKVDNKKSCKTDEVSLNSTTVLAAHSSGSNTSSTSDCHKSKKTTCFNTTFNSCSNLTSSSSSSNSVIDYFEISENNNHRGNNTTISGKASCCGGKDGRRSRGSCSTSSSSPIDGSISSIGSNSGGVGEGYWDEGEHIEESGIAGAEGRHEGECHSCVLHSGGGGSKSDGKQQLSLMDMLEDSMYCDNDTCYITQEEMNDFKKKNHQVTEQRLELRATLQKRFAQLCVNGPVCVPKLLTQNLN